MTDTKISKISEISQLSLSFLGRWSGSKFCNSRLANWSWGVFLEILRRVETVLFLDAPFLDEISSAFEELPGVCRCIP